MSELPVATLVKSEEMTRAEPEKDVAADADDELFPGIRAGGVYTSSPGVPITIVDVQTGDVVMKINSATRQITNASDRQAMTLGFNDQITAAETQISIKGQPVIFSLSKGSGGARGLGIEMNLNSVMTYAGETYSYDYTYKGLAMTFTNKRISVTISNGEEVAAGYVSAVNMGHMQDYNFRLEIHENCAHPMVAVLLMATIHQTFYQGIPNGAGHNNF